MSVRCQIGREQTGRCPYQCSAAMRRIVQSAVSPHISIAVSGVPFAKLFRYFQSTEKCLWLSLQYCFLIIRHFYMACAVSSIFRLFLVFFPKVAPFPGASFARVIPFLYHLHLVTMVPGLLTSTCMDSIGKDRTRVWHPTPNFGCRRRHRDTRNLFAPYYSLLTLKMSVMQ